MADLASDLPRKWHAETSRCTPDNMRSPTYPKKSSPSSHHRHHLLFGALNQRRRCSRQTGMFPRWGAGFSVASVSYTTRSRAALLLQDKAKSNLYEQDVNQEVIVHAILSGQRVHCKIRTSAVGGSLSSYTGCKKIVRGNVTEKNILSFGLGLGVTKKKSGKLIFKIAEKRKETSRQDVHQENTSVHRS